MITPSSVEGTSPWHILMRAHDHIWEDREARTLLERLEICNFLLEHAAEFF